MIREKNRSHTKKGPGRMPHRRTPNPPNPEVKMRSRVSNQHNFKRDA